MKTVRDILSQIIHPDAEKDIVTLGLVEGLDVDDTAGEVTSIKFRIVFPSPDPLASSIKRECERLLSEAYPKAQISIIEMVRERKQTKKTVDDLNDEQLRNIGKIIAVASGKGGVGKSTVTVNLAAALSRRGFRVGIVDADIYGPSIPKMTGTEEEIPMAEESSGLIIPIVKWNMKLISIGHLIDPDQALIWRGPMACNALKQIIMQVKWGELDYLLIDLPPGTGDIQISLVHDIPLSGAVIVTTPGQVSVVDVMKSINMFRHKDVGVPIYGIVENMAWFTPAELPDHKYYIFGREGGEKMASQLGIPFLGSVPIYLSVSEGGDNGMPVAFSDTPDGEAFRKIASQI